MLKYTSRTHEDYEDIVLALMKMREVASEINEARREAEYFQELLKVYKRLSPKPPDLLEPHRKILAEGDIFHIKSKKKTSRRYLFLFNDVLLITRSEEKKFILRIWVSLPSARIEIRGKFSIFFIFIV